MRSRAAILRGLRVCRRALPLRLLRWRLMAGVGLLWALLAVPAQASVEGGWRLMRGLRFDEALEHARALPSTAQSRFLEGVALLNVQPKVESNLDRADELMRAVIADASGDDLHPWARFYRARIVQVHRLETDAAEAVRLFDQLLEKHPGHVIAQKGRVHRAILKLYAIPADGEPAEVLGELEAGIPRLQHPAIRQAYLYHLAEGYLFYEFDGRRALQLLIEADRLGAFGMFASENNSMQIANLAFELGEVATARTYYERILAETETGPGAYWAQRQLRILSEEEGRP